MGFDTSEWTGKGTTLRRQTARRDYGLTQDEIQSANAAGRLRVPRRVHAREPVAPGSCGARWGTWSQGNTGRSTSRTLRSRTDLARVARELKRLRSETRALEEERARLLAAADRTAPAPPRRPQVALKPRDGGPGQEGAPGRKRVPGPPPAEGT